MILLRLRILPQRQVPPHWISLHIHRLIEAQHAISPQEPIHPIRRAVPPRLRNLQPSIIQPAIRRAIRDIANKHQSRRLDALDERRRKIKQSGTANQAHEVVVARDLHRFFDRDGGAAARLDGRGDRVRVGAEFVAEEDGVCKIILSAWLSILNPDRH
jgi:hypothetical protein